MLGHVAPEVTRSESVLTALSALPQAMRCVLRVTGIIGQANLAFPGKVIALAQPTSGGWRIFCRATVSLRPPEASFSGRCDSGYDP